MMVRLIRRRRSLRRNQDGAAVVEFAFALPVLIMFIWGIAQFGMVMAADAGIQNALGEGARMATLFPRPASADVKTRMQNSLFGQFLGSYTIDDPVVQNNTVTNTTTNSTTTIGQTMDLKITYTVTPDFLFFKGPQIVMPRSKRVYLTT
ncbi:MULTISPECIES: TadE/TadG family type IV pilus assembly protein [Sphingomonas]|uniref:TadE/TadG family type IV pilus assembly protein n=1 Tax=Sphingomonas TaxID=13687 RepID=UPI000DEFF363|nr:MULTISPECIES: TadE family protein [Sphingomonas]